MVSLHGLTIDYKDVSPYTRALLAQNRMPQACRCDYNNMELTRPKEKLTQGGFVFINNGQRITTNERRIIRRHVMHRAAAAKKAQGGYRKYNLGQLPVFQSAIEAAYGDCSIPPYPQTGEVLLLQRPSLRGYEAARARYDFDLSSFGILTSIHFSIASARALTSSRQRLARVLWATREKSFLDYIPRLYDQRPLIQSVVDCTLARARSTLGDNTALPETEVLDLFGKALIALQNALADPLGRYDVEVLLATNILSLCELLDFSQADRWQQHISGMIKLTEARGPHRYVTELEKSLLQSSAGTIVCSDAMVAEDTRWLIGLQFSKTLMNDEVCFLASKEWKRVLRSIGTASSASGDRDGLMEIWAIVSTLPQLFKRTRQHILQVHAEGPSEIMDLMLSCYRLRFDIISWIDRHNTQCAAQTAEARCADYGNMGGAMAAQCMVQRLLVALQPRGVEALKLEISTQDVARRLITLSEGGSQAPHQCMDLVLAQKRLIAATVLGTKDAWIAALRAQPHNFHESKSHIDLRLFDDYCERLGRSSTPLRAQAFFTARAAE